MINHKSKPGLLALFVLIIITVSACTLPMRGGENATVSAPSATQSPAETATVPEEIPATVTEIFQPEIATSTPTPLLASGSPVPTKAEPTQTPTRAITRPTQESPTHTPTPEKSPEPATSAVAEIRYVPQSGTPVVMANFVKPDLGCNFSGIGGQVFGRDQAPVDGLVVEVNGPIDGETTTLVSLTGTELSFGPGGYLVQLSDKPFDSQADLTIQVLDLTGKPESEKIPFDTSVRCDESLVLMNFVQVSPPDLYLPFLFLESKPQSPRP